MDNKTTNEAFNALVKTIAEQAQKDIPLDVVPLEAIRGAFNNGAEIQELAKHHSRYSESKGRIYPLYDDDEGYDLIGEGADTDAVVEDVWYHWTNIEQADSFFRLTAQYESLLNEISSLASWHPNYNDRNGLID